MQQRNTAASTATTADHPDEVGRDASCRWHRGIIAASGRPNASNISSISTFDPRTTTRLLPAHATSLPNGLTGLPRFPEYDACATRTKATGYHGSWKDKRRRKSTDVDGKHTDELGQLEQLFLHRITTEYQANEYAYKGGSGIAGVVGALDAVLAKLSTGFDVDACRCRCRCRRVLAFLVSATAESNSYSPTTPTPFTGSSPPTR